jgi:hypothetical protein
MRIKLVRQHNACAIPAQPEAAPGDLVTLLE